MSLINQMLRDLQEQKKGQPAQKPDSLRPRAMERIPYLPLPLKLGAAGVLLLGLIWWLSGALSDWMFADEAVVQTSPVQEQLRESGAAPGEVVVSAEADQLSREERMAQPPVVLTQGDVHSEDKGETSISDRPVEKNLASVETRTPVAAPPKPAPTNVVKQSPPVKKAAVSPPAKRPVVKKPVAKPVAKAPVRLHPDDLPGAISRSSAPVTARAPLPARPSRVAATTPYGRAKEAYLDGLWALEKGYPQSAIKAFQETLSIYPGHLQARQVLAETFAQEGQAGEAMLILSEGLDIAPDYTPFKKSYARLLMAQGDPDAALSVILQNGLPAIEADPETHVLLASLYLKVGEPFLAAQTYRNLLVAWPQTGAFWVGLGSALENQKLWDDAVDCYERALKTDNLRDDLSDYAKKRLRELS